MALEHTFTVSESETDEGKVFTFSEAETDHLQLIQGPEGVLQLKITSIIIGVSGDSPAEQVELINDIIGVERGDFYSALAKSVIDVIKGF